VPRAARSTGVCGEETVAARLVADGWTLVGRNQRVGGVEVDLIARRGREMLVVEVKSTRRAESPETALEERQRRRLLRAAAALARPGVRVAVVLAAVRLGDGNASDVRWYRITPAGPP
jgi:Holliday junction resolvase-like predicted endonuclease